MLNLYLTDYFQKKGITLNKWKLSRKQSQFVFYYP